MVKVLKVTILECLFARSGEGFCGCFKILSGLVAEELLVGTAFGAPESVSDETGLFSNSTGEVLYDGLFGGKGIAPCIGVVEDVRWARGSLLGM